MLVLPEGDDDDYVLQLTITTTSICFLHGAVFNQSPYWCLDSSLQGCNVDMLDQ
jgi:hypothetical protein